MTIQPLQPDFFHHPAPRANQKDIGPCPQGLCPVCWGRLAQGEQKQSGVFIPVRLYIDDGQYIEICSFYRCHVCFKPFYVRTKDGVQRPALSSEEYGGRNYYPQRFEALAKYHIDPDFFTVYVLEHPEQRYFTLSELKGFALRETPFYEPAQHKEEALV